MTREFSISRFPYRRSQERLHWFEKGSRLRDPPNQLPRHRRVVDMVNEKGKSLLQAAEKYKDWYDDLSRIMIRMARPHAPSRGWAQRIIVSIWLDLSRHSTTHYVQVNKRMTVRECEGSQEMHAKPRQFAARESKNGNFFLQNISTHGSMWISWNTDYLWCYKRFKFTASHREAHPGRWCPRLLVMGNRCKQVEETCSLTPVGQGIHGNWQADNASGGSQGNQSFSHRHVE